MNTTALGRQVVPLMSSGTAGPLGAIHLPRLWSKLMLGNGGVLAEGYDFCGPGFDQMTVTALNLDKQKMIDYVQAERPTYLEFERWVVEQNGGSLSPETIQRHNDAIRGYKHPPELAEKMRQASGLTDASVSDAVTLNMLEDLDELRTYLLAR